ncbi:hypothetical protein LIA77_02150 [Sarocladium implicatum]|nr:hypothetical protein LIA77_02150 [Sarocladium implicatum]
MFSLVLLCSTILGCDGQSFKISILCCSVGLRYHGTSSGSQRYSGSGESHESQSWGVGFQSAILATTMRAYNHLVVVVVVVGFGGDLIPSYAE